MATAVASRITIGGVASVFAALVHGGCNTARTVDAGTEGRDLTLDPDGAAMQFVWIDALQGWVGKYEVTNGAYRCFDAGHSSQAFTHVTTQERLTLDDDRQPAVYVSYDDAVRFAAWLDRTNAGQIPEGYRVRLPSGDEWSALARCGNEDRLYPWGDDWPPPPDWNYNGAEGASGWRKLDGHDDGFPVSCPVERSGRNDWGLYGVGGNVWEWTSERQGDGRIVRGTSWNYAKATDLRGASDHLNLPSDRNNVIGLRLVILP